METEEARTPTGRPRTIPFKQHGFDGFFKEYVEPVPLPLAVERAIECEIYTDYEFVRPVLDVGCGDGIFANILFGERVDTGIDPDESELGIARELDVYDETIACGGDAIPKPDGHYRTIFSNSVLEHIPDLPPVLDELARLLHRDGQLLVTVPTHRFEHYTIGNLALRALHLDRAAEKWQRFFKRFWNLYNVNTPETWKTMFEQAGFTLEESFEYETPRLNLLKEGLMTFSVPGAIEKRLLNRWTILPSSLRKVFIAPGVWIINRVMRKETRGGDACLIFMRFRKASA